MKKTSHFNLPGKKEFFIMKNFKKHFTVLLTITLLITAILFGACDNGAGGKGGADGGDGGSLTVSVGIAGGRAILSDGTDTDKLDHKIKITDSSGRVQTREIKAPGGTVSFFSLALGTCRIVVEGFLNGKKISEGTATKTITAGQNGSVSVKMKIIGEEEEYKFPVPGETLKDKLDWLKANAESNTNYLIEVTGNEPIDGSTYNDDGDLVYSGHGQLSYSGKTNIGITLKGGGTVSLSHKGYMFTVFSGVTLTLNNIKLQGEDDNSGSLVDVLPNGKLVMNEGSHITGNTCGIGGGVLVVGTFNMTGGTISNNNVILAGGGVFLDEKGTFNMSGGTISDNKADEYFAGGVDVSGGTFNMTGGIISGNKANSTGGVMVTGGGKFNMSGSSKIINNESTSTEGGGVSVYNGTFNMNNGTISGIKPLEQKVKAAG
jgi:hypothetical protein